MIPPNMNPPASLNVHVVAVSGSVVLAVNDLNSYLLSVDLDDELAMGLAETCRTAMSMGEAEWSHAHYYFYVYASDPDAWHVHIGPLSLTMTLDQLRRFASELVSAAKEIAAELR